MLVHLPRDGDVEAGLVRAGHGAHRAARRIGVERIGRPRRAPVRALPGRRDDTPAGIGAVEAERQRRARVARLDQDPGLQVVLEREVGPAPGDGRVAANRVVRDVEAVVVPLEDREAELEGVVEERRRRLADAAADRREEERADDHLALAEAALGRPRADRLVERERLAGADDRSVDVVRHQLDVVDPVRRGRAHVRRERGDPLPDAELLRLARREVGTDLLQAQRGAAERRCRRGGDRVGRPPAVDGEAGSGGADPYSLAVDDEARVDCPLPPLSEQRLDGLRHPLRVEPRPGSSRPRPGSGRASRAAAARASRRPRP